MNYEFPNHLKPSKKEEKEITKIEKTITIRIKGLAKNFLSGLFWFITIPISVYNKIKKRIEEK